MKYIIIFCKFLLQCLYEVLKLQRTKKNRVLFLSRQKSKLSLDFQLLKNELESKDNKIEIIFICNRFDDRKNGLFKFALNILKSMYYLATSSVCIIDAYWPAVSMLKHKKSLTVIQMWHAMGKIKKSGYQTLGKSGGRNKETAELLCMHKNYDYIIAGGKGWNPYYVESFGVSEDKLVNIGLPRIDYILSSKETNKELLYERYPELENKKIILYAPTFRRGYPSKCHDLIKYIDFDKYALIVKEHPNQTIDIDDSRIHRCEEFDTIDLLSSSEYLITDYSAVAVEAALLNVKTYYYLYDYEDYKQNNGLNVDPFDSMPGCAFVDPQSLIEELEKDNYNLELIENYKHKYLPDNLGNSTNSLATLIIESMGR